MLKIPSPIVAIRAGETRAPRPFRFSVDQLRVLQLPLFTAGETEDTAALRLNMRAALDRNAAQVGGAAHVSQLEWVADLFYDEAAARRTVPANFDVYRRVYPRFDPEDVLAQAMCLFVVNVLMLAGSGFIRSAGDEIR